MLFQIWAYFIWAKLSIDVLSWVMQTLQQTVVAIKHTVGHNYLNLIQHYSWQNLKFWLV